MNYEKGRQSKAFSSTWGASGFQISHKAGVLASNNLGKGLVHQSYVSQMRKPVLFEIAVKSYDIHVHLHIMALNRYKSLTYILSIQIRPLARPRACYHVAKQWLAL